MPKAEEPKGSLNYLCQVWIYNSFDLDVEDTGNEATGYCEDF